MWPGPAAPVPPVVGVTGYAAQMEPASPAPTPSSPWSPEVRELLRGWLSLPDGHPSELLGGQIVYRAMATFDHGAAQGGVFSQVFGSQGPDGVGGRWWISQEADVYVGGEGLRPDVVGWRIERHPEPPPRLSVDRHLGVIVAPPDWVCEVLSVSTAARDRNLKWQAYHRGGVEWYWLVDIPNRAVTVYRRTAASYEIVVIAVGSEIVHLAPFEERDFVPERLFLRAREPAGGPTG